MDEKAIETGKKAKIHGSEDSYIVMDFLKGTKQSYYVLSRANERGLSQSFVPVEMITEIKEEAAK